MENTDYMFTQPSFLAGLGRVMTLRAEKPYVPGTAPEEADRRALASDFRAVGDDLRKAMKDYQNGRK